MPRLANILVRVRDTLADPRQERWQDSQLIRLIDEGQKLLCESAELLRAREEISLLAFQPIYTLTAPATSLTRMLDEQDNVLPILSYEEMDTKYGLLWERHIASPLRAIVYNRHNPGEFRVYPSPSQSSVPSWTLLATGGPGVFVGPSFGANLQTQTTGTVTAVYRQDNNGLTAHYLAVPATLTTSTDQLAVSENLDRALKFYATGMALRDDQDAQSQQLATSELQFFQLEQRNAQRSARQDFASSRTQYEAVYQRSI